MNYKILLIFLLSTFLIGCEQVAIKPDKIETKIEKKYSNSGFALIFDENVKKIKKLDDRSLMIHHKSLKRKSAVKITNPKNGKSLIAEDLDLDFNEPLLEIVLISRNSTFIAKKSKTFDEEKNVAEKAPIDGIQTVSYTHLRAHETG